MSRKRVTTPSEEKSWQAFSLLEDYSPYKETSWNVHRMKGTMLVNRTTAYNMVTRTEVTDCPHCAGVKLYCQYRGFGCPKEDFLALGDQNALYDLTARAAEYGSKVANLVAGMVLLDRKDTMGALSYFDKCQDIPLACLMKGDIYYRDKNYESAFKAFQLANKSNKDCMAMQFIATMLKLGWGCKLDKQQASEMEAKARELGYWKISNYYFEGIGLPGASCPGSGRSAASPGSLVINVQSVGSAILPTKPVTSTQSVTVQFAPGTTSVKNGDRSQASTTGIGKGGRSEAPAARVLRARAGGITESVTSTQYGTGQFAPSTTPVKNGYRSQASTTGIGKGGRSEPQKGLVIRVSKGGSGSTEPVTSKQSVTRSAAASAKTKVQSGSDKSPSFFTPASTTTLPGTGMPPPIISSTPPVGGKFAKKINEIIDLHPVDSDRSGTPSASKAVNVGAAGSKRPGSPIVNPVPKRLTSASRHLLCSHNVRKTRCKLCNGASLCQHLRQKLHCKDCRNAGVFKKCKSFCKHNRQRSRCKECKGSGICVHNRERYRCSLCNT